VNTQTLLERLARAEEAFLRSTFVAPVTRDARVRVRVEGISWQLSVLPAGHEGWSVLQPISASHARAVRPAGLTQVREYLALFPAASLVLCERRRGTWWALLAEEYGDRYEAERPIPVFLSGEAQLFDTVRARWDGARFLFESRHPRRDASIAAYLRQSLAEGRATEALEKRTLTPRERKAYAWQRWLEEQDLRDATEARLRAAVAHADGQFHAFVERGDAYSVTFTVGGGTHTAAIRKDDLSVMVAGICLAGEDEKFDLSSLVSVIREGQGGHIVRVGDDEDLPTEVYREVHPPAVLASGGN
jgi:hypothetical protein